MNTGIIYDIKRFAIHDGPGIRTTVFLKGCPCDCWWCHNPESRSQEIISLDKEVKLDDKTIIRKEIVGESFTVDSLFDEIKKDTVFFQNSEGGVTFSGGEPMQQKSFLIQMLKRCKAEGIHTTLDTTAFFSPSALEEIMDDVDLFMIDIKFWDKAMHQKYIGLDNTIILQNIAGLLRSNKKVWIRIPVIPTINTGDMDNILRFLEEHPKPEQVNLLPYHQIGRHKYHKFGIAYRMEGIEVPVEEDMLQLKEKFELQGFTTQIGG